MGLTKEGLKNINGDDRLAELEQVRDQRQQERERIGTARTTKLGQLASEKHIVPPGESQAITAEVTSPDHTGEDMEGYA